MEAWNVGTFEDQQPSGGGGSEAVPTVGFPPEELITRVYVDLKSRARAALAFERAGHSLTATDLLHSSFDRLARQGSRYPSELEFTMAAAVAMKRLLIDHARARNAERRGGGRTRLCIDAIEEPQARPGLGVGRPCTEIALAAAIDALEAVDPFGHRVVMLRYYAGKSVEETAAALGVNGKSVTRAWTVTRLWLHDRLKHAEGA
ncbi:MAG: ECF-type sigma factor [Phycisphaerales bacterium]